MRDDLEAECLLLRDVIELPSESNNTLAGVAYIFGCRYRPYACPGKVMEFLPSCLLLLRGPDSAEPGHALVGR